MTATEACVVVRRADAQDHCVLGSAMADRNVGVVLEHGRTSDDAWNLLLHRVDISAGQEVGGRNIVRPHHFAARILHLDLVRTQARDGVERILLTRQAHRNDQDD